jgi:F0F1-type ATP synthase membrane subunit b/b'
MEFLSNLFGNLTSGIIRLGVTVGILAAVYFFIVKPVLHTTEHTVDSANKAFEESFNSATFDTKAIQEEVNKQIEDVNKQVQTEVERSFHATKVNGTQKKQEKLLHCVQRANGNVHRIERCTRKF